MEKNKSLNNQIFSNNLYQNNILRCPNCNLICSLNLKYKKHGPTINYECENGHNGNILLEKYMNEYNKFSLLKEKCRECGKSQEEIKKDFIYCLNCVTFFCNNCKITHLKKNKHNTIDSKKYDSLCKIHLNNILWYCSQCKKNLCDDCKLKHQNHSLINLSRFNISKESKKEFEEKIQKLKDKITNLGTIKENIISLLDKIIKLIEFEINFLNKLYYTYEYEIKIGNLNYHIINNLKNINQNLNDENIFNKGNEFIISLQNIYNNNLKNNFKTLNNNNNKIYYLDLLNDGRLICSSYNNLKIYRKDNFKVQLSIKEHSNNINSFTQLDDGRIISCSNDQTIIIIKLIEDDIYEIHQILTEHTNDVFKVIEIRKNELISISRDNTMKIWVLNNENNFKCILTIIYQDNYSNSNILKLNNKEFVTISCDDNCLKFWNSNNYSLTSIINDVYTTWTLKSLCLLENDILCVGGRESKGFYIIKISTHQIIKIISGPAIIWCINKCLDDLLLCSIENNGNNYLVKYKYQKENLIKIIENYEAHEYSIYSCVEINDENVASGGEDTLIKLWKN